MTGIVWVALLAVAGLGLGLAATGNLGALLGGSNLSAYAIANLAANAGFTGSDVVTATAIAFAESGGNPSAVGDQSLAPTNGPAIGLWQINSAKHTTYTQQQLMDPQTNANQAFEIFSAAGASFAPWTTYNTGAYQSFLNQADAAVNA